MEVDVTLDKPGLRSAPTAATSPEPERLVTVENDLVRIVMTTRGARIKELLLKKYAAPWKSPPNIVWQLGLPVGEQWREYAGDWARWQRCAGEPGRSVGSGTMASCRDLSGWTACRCCDGAPACTPTWSLMAVMPARCPLSMASAGSPRRPLVSRHWSAAGRCNGRQCRISTTPSPRFRARARRGAFCMRVRMRWSMR